ncbi:MAG: hypothetical protein ACP5VR_02915 [Acidimicrobiales bacterium]
MARFLSPEWFGELSRLQQSVLPAPEAPELVIEVLVTAPPDDPGATVAYHVALQGNYARALPPVPDREPQVRFTTDYATAAAIASGHLSAYDALLKGRTRVFGQAALLVAHQSVLAGRDLIPAPLRASTTF